MDLFEAINGRRSIRAFRSTPIPEIFMEKILEAASSAPSAGNFQAWEFIVIKDASMKSELYRRATDHPFICDAPIDIVVCVNQAWYSEGYGNRGRELYSICDAAAATENIHLAAHGLGLGSCWVGDFKDDIVSELLGLPPNVKPIAIVPIGYPDMIPSPRVKRPLRDAIHIEKYGVKRGA